MTVDEYLVWCRSSVSTALREEKSMQRIVSGARVKGALTGDWYTVTVSANLQFDKEHNLMAIVSGMIRRDGDVRSVSCSVYSPVLVSHTEIQ
jgi:hypothetical protein